MGSSPPLGRETSPLNKCVIPDCGGPWGTAERAWPRTVEPILPLFMFRRLVRSTEPCAWACLALILVRFSAFPRDFPGLHCAANITTLMAERRNHVPIQQQQGRRPHCLGRLGRLWALHLAAASFLPGAPAPAPGWAAIHRIAHYLNPPRTIPALFSVRSASLSSSSLSFSFSAFRFQCAAPPSRPGQLRRLFPIRPPG